MTLTSHSVTRLLLDWSEGDREALDLRLRAARYLRQERPGHTLQTTALIGDGQTRLEHGESVVAARDELKVRCK